MQTKNIVLAASVATILTASAATPRTFEWPEGSFTNATVERTPTSLVLSMDVHPSVFDISASRQAWLRPVVVAQGDTLWLNPVIIAGRTRYYQNQRVNTVPENGIMLRSGSPESYSYQAIMPYESWMDVCDLILIGEVSGCAGDCIGSLSPDQPLASCDFRPKVLTPEYIYVSPVQEIVKTRAAKGEAYIDFPVGKTTILPDFRSNRAELNKIKGTIDRVKKDKDYTITSLDFRGYASPEGSYAANERLAKGRTEALIEYVRKLYSFPASLLHSSWVAEDWEGLEARLRELNIANREGMLAIVTNKSLTPDQKDQQLKKDFPTQYNYLLANVYPALRRCDYVVSYNVRNYTDISEIATVIATAPQNLSLAEIFSYAQTLDNSSPEFQEVMEVAVRMFPSDPVANLNAATTAVKFGDYERARNYLKKAQQGGQYYYTAGLLEALQGNYEDAAPMLRKAAEEGIGQAAELLKQMTDWGWIK